MDRYRIEDEESFSDFQYALDDYAPRIANLLAALRQSPQDIAMLGELMAVVAMAAETNTLANAYRVPVDDRFRQGDDARPRGAASGRRGPGQGGVRRPARSRRA